MNGKIFKVSDWISVLRDKLSEYVGYSRPKAIMEVRNPNFLKRLRVFREMVDILNFPKENPIRANLDRAIGLVGKLKPQMPVNKYYIAWDAARMGTDAILFYIGLIEDQTLAQHRFYAAHENVKAKLGILFQ